MHAVDNMKALFDELHIHMDNQCFFLPQERISQFSELEPTRLLRETMRSVGTGVGLTALFDDIVTMQKEFNQVNREEATLTQSITDRKTELASLERDHNAFKQYQALERTLKVIGCRWA